MVKDMYLDASINYTKNPQLDMFKMHSHEHYEIYCFLSGSAKYFVEGNIYSLKPNDILLMKKAESHSLLIDKHLPYKRMVINFNSQALLKGADKKIVSFIDNRPLGRFNKYSASKYKDKNFWYYLDKICNSDDIEQQRLYLTVLLNELCDEYPLQTDEENTDNIKEIINYINNHLFEDLSLDNISEIFYISKTHLTRKFKKYTGSTVWDYILTKRLLYAKELLKNGEKPTDVYVDCGFNDYCSFYRAYKLKFNLPPKDDYNKK